MTDFPLHPPAEWFDVPEPDGPQPLTITDDGQVTGHLALWSSCHTGFSECLTPPRGVDGYESFHVGALETDQGELAVGKLMYASTHAPLGMQAAAASAHYDDNGHVGAYVRAKDGRHGIWLSGAVRSDISAEDLVTLKANPPSGDWRSIRNRLTMIAALAVPVPGYPVARSQQAVTASGEMEALILEGYDGTEEPMEAVQRTREFIGARAALVAAALTTTRRNDLPARDFVFPSDRRYPIDTRARAANALARSSGKPEEAQVRRAVCRRYPDMESC